MANDIQVVRNIYEIVKAFKDNTNLLTDDNIRKFLEDMRIGTETINEYKRFERGYAAEDLFMRIYSLLPWVKLITPLGQEQFPEKSKSNMQVADYELVYEVGDSEHSNTLLVEVKLVNGDKKTQEIKKYQYDVLNKYAKEVGKDILYALFWWKLGFWTLVPIEAYSEKSSVYKISLLDAIENDVSSIFGDYTYIFRDEVYRKSRYSTESIETKYFHKHEKYGQTLYEALSLDDNKYEELCSIETPVLDCAFDLKEKYVVQKGRDTEVTEILEHLPYVYRLSILILKYILKIYCYDPKDMYWRDNDVVKNAFHIVDTVRRKCGGKKYYLLPRRNSTTDRLFNMQFGNARHIIEAYKKVNHESGRLFFVSHD